MIQSYDQIKKQANLINDDVDESVFIQKIYSSSYFLCLTIRLVGKSKFLYIGRGSGNEGLWFSDLRVESFLRKRDKFLEYIRKHLSSTSFDSLTVDTDDRIFSLNYNKWGRINRFFFFYNARNLYFANHFYDVKSGEMKFFKSWTMKNENQSQVSFNIFDEVGRANLERKSDVGTEVKDITDIAGLLANEKKSAMKGNHGGKSKKFYNRKRRRILGDLEKVESIKELRELAQSCEDMSKLERIVVVGKVKLKFKNPDHFKRRDEVYTKIKKINKAKEILTLRLADTDDNLVNYTDVQLINNLKTVSPVWKSLKNITEVIKSTEKSYDVINFGNLELGIGLNANGNDQLRSEWAKKSDYWFHLDGDKSPHIIIKLKDLNLTEDVFTVVASALIFYSKIDYREANLIYTQVKNLKGVKGASGKVIVKKEKRIRVVYNADWKDITF
jgi:hypothetical protein